MTTRHVAAPGEVTNFSAALRAATWQDHQHAESSPFMDALMAGEVGREGYARLLGQQLHAYRVIEAAAEVMAADTEAGPFVFPELSRCASIEADLAALLGDDWADRIPATDATREYCSRLAEVTTTWPGGFVAHHYTRYLGDLSGGQFIGRVVRRTLGIDESSGAAFFTFDGVPDPSAFKDRYRELLDAAPWDEQEQRRVIDEIRRAYQLNTAVLTSLPIDG